MIFQIKFSKPDVDDLNDSEKDILKNNIGILQSLNVKTLSATGVRVMQNYLEGTLNLHEDVSSGLNKNTNLENIAKDTVELLVDSIADNLPYVYEPGVAILNPHLDRAKIHTNSSQAIQSQAANTTIILPTEMTVTDSQASTVSKGIKRSLGEMNIIDVNDRRKTKFLSSSHLKKLQEPVKKKTIISHTEFMLLHPCADKRDKIILSDFSPSSDSSDNIIIGELIRKRENVEKVSSEIEGKNLSNTIPSIGINKRSLRTNHQKKGQLFTLMANSKLR